jgi:hypothetical protein
MRSYILAICGAACLALPAAAASGDAGTDAPLLLVQHREYYQGRWGYGPDCRELRRACMYKRELGEEGRGNCQRYRELCR